MLKDDQPEITRNKIKIQNLQTKLNKSVKRWKKIEGQKKKKRVEIRELIKKRSLCIT